MEASKKVKVGSVSQSSGSATESNPKYMNSVW